MEFGVGFLEEDNPELVLVVAGEDRASAGETRHVVVNNDLSPDSALADADLVDALIVGFVDLEQSFD